MGLAKSRGLFLRPGAERECWSAGISRRLAVTRVDAIRRQSPRRYSSIRSRSRSHDFRESKPVLTRQKTILRLLSQAGKPLSPTAFVKLAFLLRQETDLGTNSNFYDFVPYRFGPFSFALYSELRTLRQNGYVATEEDKVALCDLTLELAEMETKKLPVSIHDAIDDILDRYGELSQTALLRSVYTRYPWFAINSELPERRIAPLRQPRKALPAVYTAGYEGKSVDAFFNDLLKQGIEVVVDVRNNPISRKYGFSRLRFQEIAVRLGLEYRHMPTLGIPSHARADLSDFASYQSLLQRYELKLLPEQSADVAILGHLMCQRPSVLVCVEKDVRCCHRSRLAETVARRTDLDIVHLG